MAQPGDGRKRRRLATRYNFVNLTYIFDMLFSLPRSVCVCNLPWSAAIIASIWAWLIRWHLVWNLICLFFFCFLFVLTDLLFILNGECELFRFVFCLLFIHFFLYFPCLFYLSFQQRFPLLFSSLNIAERKKFNKEFAWSNIYYTYVYVYVLDCFTIYFKRCR